MDRRTIITLGALGGAVALAAAVFGRTPRAAAELRVPTDRAEVLEALPYGATDARSREMDRMRRALAENPRNLRLATRLAQMDIQLNRARGDPRFLGRAQAALSPWWSDPNAPEPAIVLRATIEQSLHDFDASLADLDRATKAEPDDPQAWLTLAAVLTVRARYDEARDACARLVAIAPPLVPLVCATQIDSVTGHAKDAYARLSAAATELDRDSEAWARGSLGEYAERAGDLDGAEREMRRALELDPDDAYTRAALADLWIDRRRYDEAAALVRGREVNDNLLLRLAIAEKFAHAPQAATHADALGARFDASRLRGDAVHRREESRYWLTIRGDADRALALAKANWGVQKEPWDVRVYLEAARAAKGDASPAREFVAKTHLEDPFIAPLLAP